MSKKILFAAFGGLAFATSAAALPLSPLQSSNGIVEARIVCDEYGHCRRQAPAPPIPRFEGRSIYKHQGYLYDPVERRHYDRTRGKWVTDVGSPPGE